MRWRYMANSFCYLMTTPTSPLAARVAYSFQTYPGQWRNWYFPSPFIGAPGLIMTKLLFLDRNQRDQRSCLVFFLPWVFKKPKSAYCIRLWLHLLDPPTFSMLHRKKLAKELLFNFDWMGVLLYSGSLCIFIFGLNWGGVL